MLVLFTAVFILVGAPAILLLAGWIIQVRTDALHHGAPTRNAKAGSEWYYRAPKPVFGRAARVAARVPAAADQHGEQWFYRPMPPVFVWPDVRRIGRS